ncbi:hypothetical protein SEMRO_642_G180090.1 [Seminavis robusta]|uniref:Uncharacterized protein n=1 Tax=Seminavis robusta TaxID=568900 RepID=A0A9N8E908_9STRA|nr:hypothetical protein SEMRO_642_G180090.1 [Seminavis robusta]|eukprot:Sro642_g180090.1 n/a (228) ;mRNA; f:2261-3211
MALARLWACFDEDAKHSFPDFMEEPVVQAFITHYGPQLSNPVVKIPLVVTNMDGNLHIVDQVVIDADGAAESSTTAVQTSTEGSRATIGGAASNASPIDLTGNGTGTAIVSLLGNMVQQINQRFDTMQANQNAHRTWAQRQFARVNENQRRYGGSIEQALIWQILAYLVNGGLNIQAAIARMNRVYPGDGRVTGIIDRIIADGKDENSIEIPAVGFPINPQLVVGNF